MGCSCGLNCTQYPVSGGCRDPGQHQTDNLEFLVKNIIIKCKELTERNYIKFWLVSFHGQWWFV